MGKYENADSKNRKWDVAFFEEVKNTEVFSCRIAMLQELQLKGLCGTFRSRAADEELSTKQVIEPEGRKEPE